MESARYGRFRRRHDADADWINVVGMHWKGRDTVRRAHVVLHAGMFAQSRMLPPEQSEMRQIAPNVVVETHVGRLADVGLRPDGKPYPDDGNLMTMVFVKSRGGVANCACTQRAH
jgi:hypothetical protein